MRGALLGIAVVLLVATSGNFAAAQRPPVQPGSAGIKAGEGTLEDLRESNPQVATLAGKAQAIFSMLQTIRVVSPKHKLTGVFTGIDAIEADAPAKAEVIFISYAEPTSKTKEHLRVLASFGQNPTIHRVWSSDDQGVKQKEIILAGAKTAAAPFLTKAKVLTFFHYFGYVAIFGGFVLILVGLLIKYNEGPVVQPAKKSS